MKKTILLGLHDRLSLKGTKTLYISLGILFLVNGFFQIFNQNYRTIGIILGILMVIASFVHLFFAFNVLSKKSKYAPKLEVDQETIRFKAKVFKPAEEILWKEIKSVALHSYQLNFDLGTSQKKFNYTTTPEISKELKKTILEVAKSKSIEVTSS